jgi:hypothetical protein
MTCDFKDRCSTVMSKKGLMTVNAVDDYWSVVMCEFVDNEDKYQERRERGSCSICIGLLGHRGFDRDLMKLVEA